jgi:hypothetical protein
MCDQYSVPICISNYFLSLFYITCVRQGRSVDQDKVWVSVIRGLVYRVLKRVY